MLPSAGRLTAGAALARRGLLCCGGGGRGGGSCLGLGLGRRLCLSRRHGGAHGHPHGAGSAACRPHTAQEGVGGRRQGVRHMWVLEMQGVASRPTPATEPQGRSQRATQHHIHQCSPPSGRQARAGSVHGASRHVLPLTCGSARRQGARTTAPTPAASGKGNARVRASG
jgi:hypothetical protein